MTKTIVENPKSTIQLISFDIFDTLVTRRVATPVGIFALMQEFIKKETNLPDFIKNNFYSIRINSEKIARMSASQLYKTPEISFDDIYSVMQNNCYLTDEEVKFLKELEISTEIKNLVPIDKNISLLKEYINAGKKVILISDMYHSSETIHKFLSHIDTIFYNIKIYVSSEHKVSKVQGELYKVVKDTENIDYTKWQHIGDNPLADIKQAARYGIKTITCKTPELLLYEKKYFNPSDIYSQCIIGAARLSRFNKPQLHQNKYDFGASYTAPLLYSYVSYIIEQSRARGLKELYFIARDGYIPKIIADIIIEKYGLDIKTKYIYGSRLAWRVFTEDNFENLVNIIFDEYNDKFSFNLLAYRLGIAVDVLAKFLDLKPSDKILKHNQKEKIKKKILSSTNIRKKIIENNQNKINKILEYFKQEVNLDNPQIAFVDLHGSGRTQDMLVANLEKICPNKILFFYFACVPMSDKNNSVKASYFTNFRNRYWIELLSKSSEGQTLGYDYCDKKIKAITEKINKQYLDCWGINEYVDGIKVFSKILTECEEINKLKLTSILFVQKYINYVNQLDKETAEILGSIPHKTIGEENNIIVSAPKISFKSTLKNFLLCRKEKEINDFSFISSARSSKLKKKWLKFLEKCPTIQKFLLNVYIHKKEGQAYIRILGIKISFGGLLWNKRGKN